MDNARNRREVLQLGIVGGLGALIEGVGFAGEPSAAELSSTKVATGEAPIRTRVFWTWDHSTEWALNRLGAHTHGSCNEYGRTRGTFIEDYTTLLRWCGRHNIDAVVVWGLLRDCHGGLESAKRLCDVAAKENVRLLCGVGLNAYGGVYYEGDSPHNLERHLQAHPELLSVDADGKPLCFQVDADGRKTNITTVGMPGPRGFYQACPSRRENQDFAMESLAWLFKNLPLGGVQIESGDTGICQCKRCRDRRKHSPADFSWFSWEDMGLMYPLAAEAIRSVAPDAWIVCETYSHPQPYTGPDKAPQFGDAKPVWADAELAKFPRGAFVQWVCDRFLDDGPTGPTWTAEGRVSDAEHRNIMRAHCSTYWWGIRGELALQRIARMVQKSAASGFDAVSLFGEVSPFCTGAELNYLAMADFGGAGNPKADIDSFLRRVAAPLLGGLDNAHDFVRLARLLDDRKQIPAALTDIYGRLPKLPPSAARRWCWLANHLASFVEPSPA
ncbi:MAG: hypothetical protein JXQ73_09220 [Phycisphaerae bacterium]|nr:hypothetical protein [Phycisphaerae bacterium]